MTVMLVAIPRESEKKFTMQSGIVLSFGCQRKVSGRIGGAKNLQAARPDVKWNPSDRRFERRRVTK
jgi:hypothetical protein